MKREYKYDFPTPDFGNVTAKRLGNLEIISLQRSHHGLLWNPLSSKSSGLGDMTVHVPVVAFKRAAESQPLGWGACQPGCIPPSTTACTKSVFS